MFSAKTGEETKSSSLPWEQLCRHFSLAEIQSATQNFDDALVIGQGGFGKVYKGPINNEATNFAAIKRLDARSNQGAPEFQAELEMLSKLRHCHLVSLIGYCNDGEEMILVYDYMPRGTLEDHLHKIGTSLSWLQRLKICIGAARGLDYLHTGMGTQHGVIHRDVKTSNILLDENWDAKISDFGLSKIGPTNQPRTYVSTGVKGTFGYLDPEYFSTGRLTRKSDVYAFGVVLFEALCGRRAVDTTLDEEQWGLAGWAQDCIKERKLDKIIDSSLRGQISPDSLKEFAWIANRCLHSRPKQRPTMAEVVVKLERTFFLQERKDSSANKRTFIGKMRLFFSAKSELKLERRPVPPLTEVESDGISVRAVGTAQTEVAPHGKASANLVLFDDSFVFTLEELLGSSAEFISKSTYWTTYKASLADGYQVVIKRKRNMLIHSQFEVEQHEVAALGKIRHPNILALRGYYWSREEKLCIYDYMPIGSVSSLLHTHWPQSATQWPTRMNIIMGITRGLFYLHSQENIVHGNLTTSNILLDNHSNPVIADVGLSRQISSAAYSYIATAGEPSNHAPELLESKSANSATDIYSLGVIMLELLTGISTGKETDVPSLPHWVKTQMKEQTIRIFDPKLKMEATNAENDLFQTLNVALLCVETSPTARPEAQQILQMLEEVKPDVAASVEVP